MKKINSSELQTLAICVALFFGTFLIFSHALQNNFLDLDDPDYVTQNAHVKNGLALENVRWAFTATAAGNWHPLTWLSLMADAQIFGNSARGFHFTNIFLHALNAMLAFLALRKLTGAIWTSAICAALFAWHPLRVESVAWVAERKDVLSGFFFFLTLLAWTHFVEKREIQNPKSKIFYVLAFVFFACGLMSKPMLVTVPFVLLLLDFWPFQRFDRLTIQQIAKLVVEKIPFFLLSVAACVITFFAQKNGGAVVESQIFGERFGNAVVSILRYLGNFFWPENLAVVYPLPNDWPMAIVLLSAILIFCFTTIAIFQMRQRPWLFVGWFWFLGMLVPVVGFVQVGLQAMADRYTYLPMFGFEIALLWTLREIILSLSVRRIGIAISVSVLLAGCVAQTWNQIAFWKNSRALYEHALAVTKNNYLAESNLGTTLFNEGNFSKAESHFRRAIELNPDFATARLKLGIVLEQTGRADEALAVYQELLKIRPRDADTQYNVGVLLLNKNQPSAAFGHFETAAEIKPDNVSACVGLGLAAEQLGRVPDAIRFYQRAFFLNPAFPGLADKLAAARDKTQF